MSLVVVESPLHGKDAAEQQRNLRYLLWCLRALWEVDGHHGIASHLVCPFFLDDAVDKEREAGIGWEWFWLQDAEHTFFNDLGVSSGMRSAASVCRQLGFQQSHQLLFHYAPDHWAAFERGEWPPHTTGFSLSTRNPIAPMPALEAGDP